MKKICGKCNEEVFDKDITPIGVQLKEGRTLEPQIFAHKDCGGEVINNET